MKRRESTQGQTLVELVMLITLLGIISVPTISIVTDSLNETRFATTKLRLLEIRKALVGDPTLTERGQRSSFGYQGDVGSLPADPVPGLAALWTKPGAISAYAVDATAKIGTGWGGPYLNYDSASANYLNDGWGNPFIYNPAASPPTVISYGANGVAGGNGFDQDITMELPVNVMTATVFGVIIDSTTPGVPWNNAADIELNEPNGLGGIQTLSTSIAAGANGAFSFTGVPIGIRSVTVYIPNKAAPTKTMGPVIFAISSNNYLIPTGTFDVSL